MKRCLHCESPAEYSVCAVISTLGLSGRRQKCTTSLPFCALCLQRLCADGEGGIARQIREALQTAFRALTQTLQAKLERETCRDQEGDGLAAKRLV